MTVKGKANVSQILELSTAHLPQETVQRIEDGEFPKPAWMKSEYGFLVSVPDEEDIDGNFGAEQMPIGCESMILCLRRAIALDCAFIMFDRDSELVEDLPAFDW